MPAVHLSLLPAAESREMFQSMGLEWEMQKDVCVS